MKFLIKVIIDTTDESQAWILRDEIVGVVEAAQDRLTSGEVSGMMELETDRVAQVRAAAAIAHTMGDEIEIDDDTCLSEGDDGPWIQAWLFVPKRLCPPQEATTNE